MKHLAIILVIGCMFNHVAAQNFEYSFTETYNIATPAHLDISSSDGNIEVTPWDKPGVQVYFIAKRMGHLLQIDKNELEQQIILEIDAEGNTLHIAARNKPSQSFLNWGNTINVSFKIYAPAQMSSELGSSDGDITVKGVFTGDQQCKTSDGNVNVEKVTGNVSGHTSDGDVRVDNVQGRVDVRTSDGDVHLSYIQGDAQCSTSDGSIDLLNLSGSIEAKTSDGSIEFDNLAGGLMASTSDGNIRGSMVKVTGQLSLKSSDGNIDVKVPGDVGWDLSIRGESLHVPLKNFSGQADKHSIQGKINGGGSGMILVTSDGSVSVDYN